MSFSARSHLKSELKEPSVTSAVSSANTSNVKIVCRIRPPKSYETQRENSRGGALQQTTKSYTSVRQRNRSNSKDVTSSSPYRQYASLRQTSKDGRQRSSSKENSKNRSSIMNKSSHLIGNGQVCNDKKYCVFTTKERSNIVVACENPVPGKIINESLVDVQDLKYFNNAVLGQNSTFTFNFDQVFNEGHKQEKFYSSTIRPVVKSFVEGENACIVLFGPTEGGKTYSLKGKTGIERGILPRAVEDIFNIVRNSEEREEDYELLNNRMMRDDEDEEDMYPESQHFNKTYDSKTYNSTRNFNQLDQTKIVPERMFLKVSVYQIFVDKVLDLLTTSQKQSQKVQVDHYIDKESEEVVSKLKNITEKVVFTLEDFYSVLQEAFKNRRIESVSMQEQDLRKKSHFIINLTLMKRTQCKKLIEISSLNFVELSGSEQAVAEEKFYKDSSVRQFVTRSFNGVSSQIVKAALKKRTKNQSMDEGDIKIVNCLRNTLTSTSNIVLLCCINPGPSCFDHSLPAVKFCARIRDCILKKLHTTKRVTDSNQSVLTDDVRYNNGAESERGRHQNTISGSSFETMKEIVEHLKEDVINKQLQRQRNGDISNIEPWYQDRMETIDKLFQRNRTSNHLEKQKMMIEQELNFVKENINKLRYGQTLLSPKQVFGPSLQDTYRSQQSSAERPSSHLRTDSSHVTSYNPYQAQSYNYMNSDLKFTSGATNFNYSQQEPVPEYVSSQQIASSQHRHIYQEDQEAAGSQERQKGTPTTGQSNNYDQNSQGASGQRTKLRPHNLNQQQQYQGGNHYSSQEQQLQYMEADNNRSVERNEIKVYGQSDSRYISRIQQVANTSQSIVICPENDFLSKAHPLVDIPLKAKKNSISENNSPERQEEHTQTFSGNAGFRPAPRNLANLQKTQQQNQTLTEINTILDNTSKMSFKSPLQNLQSRFISQINNVAMKQNTSSISSPHQQIGRRVQNIKKESVYQSSQEAMSDINRLIKLNDFEGLKLRVMQIYKEKEDQDKIMDEQQEILVSMKEQSDLKEQILEDQDKIIKETHQEFQDTIDDINQHKTESERSLHQKAKTLNDQFMDYQSRLSDLQHDKERLLKAQEILELENRQLVKLKEEADQKQQKTQEENDRMHSNYDILKEHEMNIIKDYEGKKSREVGFYESKIVELHSQVKEEQLRAKDLEEQHFRNREDIRRSELDLEKANEDKKHMIEQIQKIGSKLEQEEESRMEIGKQLDHVQSECQRLSETKEKLCSEREKAFQEIEKLHLLIEEMEKAIQIEQEKSQDEKKQREMFEKEKDRVEAEKRQIVNEMLQKEQELEESCNREQELQNQISKLGNMHEQIDKQLTLMKAKEYDKVDILKRAAELEARMKYLQVDNENLVRERNNLDLANVNFNKEKSEMDQQIISLESELDYFRKSHENHLDKFDSKFESISIELSKLKNENIQLKEKEKLNKRTVKELEEEKDEYKLKYKTAEKKCDEMNAKLYDLERDVRALLQERERDVKDSVLRQSLEVRLKEENKGKMLGDIQNMIKQYKDDKKLTKSGTLYSSTGAQNNNGGYSSHSSVYY